jgi:hypothetical protein
MSKKKYSPAHAGRRVQSFSVCSLLLLSAWSIRADADPLRRIDQIKAALAAPKARDASAFADKALARDGLRHRRPSRPFPPGYTLAMPSWNSQYVRDGVSYPTTVIGTDPALGQTTTIPTVIFAYRLQLADGRVFDASSDVIDGVTPVQGVLASPIFQNAPWRVGGTSLGTTQWGDAVMHANFWGRMSAGYHVLLGTPTVIPITVDVPAADGYAITDPLSGVVKALIDFDWLFNLNYQVTLAYGIPPTTLPIHLFSQVTGGAYGYEVAAGYHDIYFPSSSSPTLAAPFIQASYLSKALAIPVGRTQGENTGVLAHEVAEWLMDPTVGNNTSPWQDPAYPRVCDNPLMEVADPLEDIAPGMDVGGYRFPDVALEPWFTGSDRRQSVNHQYSLLGTLTAPASVCPQYANFDTLVLGITGADATYFTGINNRHQVVGYFTVGNGLGSYILSNVDPLAGTPITVASVYVPNSLVTYALGLNDAGNVVGIYFDGQQREHGFLLQGTTYTSIDFPGAVATEALGTNKHGDIVGDYTDTAGTVHGFVLMEGHFRGIDAPFASGLTINAINDSRIVAGTYSSRSTTASFSGPLWDLQPFSFPQVSPLLVSSYPVTFATYANGINNSQEIVGGVSGNANPITAYVAKAGLFERVSPGTGSFDGAQSAQLTGVNDSGFAVGAITDYAGSFGIIQVPGSALGLPYQRVMIAAP